MSETKCGVYLVSIGYDDLFKIGSAIDIDQRVYDFQGSNPKCSLVAWAPVPLQLWRRWEERSLQSVFSGYHVQREVFRFPPEALPMVLHYFHLTELYPDSDMDDDA